MDEYGQASVTGPNLIRSRDQAFCFTQFYKKELSTSPSPSPFKNSETELTTCGTPQPNTLRHAFTTLSLSVGRLFGAESWGKERAWETGNREYNTKIFVRESSVRKHDICRLSLWAHSSPSTHAAYSEYLLFVSVIATTSKMTLRETNHKGHKEVNLPLVPRR